MLVPDPQASLLKALSATLPGDWIITWNNGEANVPYDHPLLGEIEALAAGSVCSFPYLRGPTANWVTFGGTAEHLRDSIDTLRAWLMPVFASEDRNPIVSPVGARGRLAEQIIAVSAHGYYRWSSPTSGLRNLAAKLAEIRHLEQRRPKRQRARRLSLQELRSEFQIAFATADWQAAEAAIAQIDAMHLDSALNTEQMRVRLWGSVAEYERVVERAEAGRLLALNITERVRQLILEAYSALQLRPLEDAEAYESAAKRYKECLHVKLCGSILELRELDSVEAKRLVAYRAWVDGDKEALLDGRLPADDPVVINLRELANAGKVRVALPDTEGGPQTQWGDLIGVVLSNRDDFIDGFLDRSCTPTQLAQTGQGDACADSLLQLFTDNGVSSQLTARRCRHRVLTRVIETVLCDAAFPVPQLYELYRVLLDVWVMEHGDSSFPPYGQLVLALSEGLLQLSASQEEHVIQCIKAWWNRRASGARLSWLLESIDLLSLHTANSLLLQDLWVAGSELVRRDESQVPRSEVRLWRQLAQRLAIPETTVSAYFGPVGLAAIENDLLASAGLRRIAIVTLKERAGRVARDLLAERTGAEVVVVNSTVADSSTRTALDSDLILFVWAASKHAVLRAFDGVREKLEYVQGTGPTSIVLAAERWIATRDGKLLTP